MEHPRGSEFYYQRLERACALPEADRSADVKAWLASHDALDAAVQSLPLLQPGQTLTEPAGGSAALAAVLKLLAHSYCHPPEDPMHPEIEFCRLSPQLPPLMRVIHTSSKGDLQPTPLLKGILASGRLPPGGTDLALVARMLLLVLVLHTPDVNNIIAGLNVLHAARLALFNDSRAAQLTQQLAQLQEELSSSDGSSDELPTVQQLQVVWSVLTLGLAAWPEVRRELPAADIMSVEEEAVGCLLRLQPDKPRSSFEAGKVRERGEPGNAVHSMPTAKRGWSSNLHS